MYTESISIPIQLSSEESILHVAFVDKDFANEIILLSDKSNLFRKNLGNGDIIFVLNLDDLLDVSQPVRLYTYQNYLAIVNQRGKNGIVLNLVNNTVALKLLRGEYQVEHCSFPIAFYSRENNVYLIHGTDWNRLDITCLNTGELLTERVVQYDKEAPINYLDYFHSSLCLSPNELSFISNGWVWQPYDVMLLWTIEDFLQTYEVEHHSLSVLETSGYNWDRPLCWIDNQTIGYGYNEQEGTTIDVNHVIDSHIIIQHVGTNEIIEKVPFNGFNLSRYGEVSGTLEFNRQLHVFVGFSDEKGVTILDKNGTLLFRDNELKPITYSTGWNAFLSITNNNQVNIVRLHQ